MVRSLFAVCAVFGLGLAAPTMMLEGKRGEDCGHPHHHGNPGGYPQGPAPGQPQPQTQPPPQPQPQPQPPVQPQPSQPTQPQGTGYPQAPAPSQPQGSSYPQGPSPPQPQASSYSQTPPSPSPQPPAPQPQSSSYPSSPAPTGTTGGSGATPGGPYKTYTGSGADWPTMSQWVGDYETLFNANKPAMMISCEANGWGANNSPQEIQSIHDNLKSVASANGLDPRFLLSIMMQESKGCVRVKTTANAHPNPGLMQSGGTASCVGMTPCPDSQIKAMIQDGVTAPDGLKETMAKATGPANGLKLYRAAVLYNSGINLDVSTTLAGPGAATPCYASDIVNRLMGTLTGAASGCSAPS